MASLIYGSTYRIEKQLAAASANNIALSQTPVSGTRFTLNGATVTGGVAILDTQRRVIVTAGSEAAQRTVVLTGTNSQNALISETITIPASTSGAVSSQLDYLTVTSALPLGGGWTAAATIGTNAVGSSAPQIMSHYQAIFNIGFDVTVTGTASCTIECTWEVPYALPQIYTPGMTFTQPIVHWDAWTTLTAITTEASGDVDSPVNAWRLTVNSGTGLCVARGIPVGLRT
jgi:hypothetical protein